jgi:hypothetical protein
MAAQGNRMELTDAAVGTGLVLRLFVAVGFREY